MGIVGGPRHYGGAHGNVGGAPGQPTKWRCPSCRGENLSIMEEGCPQCGAGTLAQAEEARSRRVSRVDPTDVARAVLGQPTASVSDLTMVRNCLAPIAQLTLARALAHYAEHGVPQTKGEGQELTRAMILGWAIAMDPPEPAPVPRQE